MAIKTDELQHNNAPALTDTLLMASSAAGTTRLTLAQAAAFFGAELVKTGNPVGTALSNKAAKSAQEAVEKTGASSRTVELAASELPAFIAALPRLLTEDLTIKVSGTLNEHLYLHRFYGCGSIWIEGSDGCACQKGLYVSNCSIGVTLKNLALSGHLKTGNDIVMVQISHYVSMQNCTVTGSKAADNEGECGVRVRLSSLVNMINCGITSCGTAVLASGSSLVTLYNNSGDSFSGNAIGPNVYEGGILLLSGQTPELLGGAANAKSGGLIVKKDGTLL